jgi:hypothetical protein
MNNNQSSMGSLLTWNEEQKKQSAQRMHERPATAQPHVEDFKQGPVRNVQEPTSQW